MEFEFGRERDLGGSGILLKIIRSETGRLSDWISLCEEALVQTAPAKNSSMLHTSRSRFLNRERGL